MTPPDIDGVSDKKLDELFCENLLPDPGEKYKTLEAIFPTIEKELKRRGITKQILLERYFTTYPVGKVIVFAVSPKTPTIEMA